MPYLIPYLNIKKGKLETKQKGKNTKPLWIGVFSVKKK